MTKSIKQALEQSIIELNVPIAPKIKLVEYTIVDFCLNYLKLPIQETVNISNTLIEEYPIVYINEGNWGDTLQNFLGTKASQYGNRIRQSAQNKFGVGVTGNAAKVKQPWTNPIAKIGQGMQDTFNTKGSALRNSPMVRVDDNAKGITKYIAFPDLDLTRPGHKRVLDSIIQGLNSSGSVAQQINIAAPERAAAQQAGNYAEISTPATAENKKEAVEAALQQLEDLVTTNKDALNKYSFISNEELQALQQQISQAAGDAGKTITDASQESTADTAAIVKEAEQAASKPGNSQSTAGEPSAYSEELGKIQSGADLQAQMSNTTPTESVPQATEPTMATATSTVPQASQIPGLEVPEINASDLAGMAKKNVTNNALATANTNGAATTEPVIPQAQPVASSQTLTPENNQEIAVEPPSVNTVNPSGIPNFNFTGSAGPITPATQAPESNVMDAEVVPNDTQEQEPEVNTIIPQRPAQLKPKQFLK